MKGLITLLIIAAIITLVLGVFTKIMTGVVAGIGPTGLLNATMVLLLFAANFALLELLKKK